MRTTIDIPDETYREVKTIAAQESTTVRQLVLEGLSLVTMRHKPSKARRLTEPPLPKTGDFVISPTEEQLIDAFFGPID